MNNWGLQGTMVSIFVETSSAPSSSQSSSVSSSSSSQTSWLSLRRCKNECQTQTRRTVCKVNLNMNHWGLQGMLVSNSVEISSSWANGTYGTYVKIIEFTKLVGRFFAHRTSRGPQTAECNKILECASSVCLMILCLPIII
jgi:hypothetical protein